MSDIRFAAHSGACRLPGFLFRGLFHLTLHLGVFSSEVRHYAQYAFNEHRPHSGKYCFGKTPMQTFLDSRHLAHEKELDRLAVVTLPDALSPCAVRAAPTVS